MQYPLISEYVKSDNLDMSTKATEEERKEALVDEWGVKYSKDGRRLLKAPQKLDSTYSIKEGVKIICDSAFFGCYSLSEIVIPSSVTSIGHSAFFFCESLTSIAIPSSVTSIGDCAFEGCESLRCLVIPDGVSSIGTWAFMGCSSLSSLVIPGGVTSIGNSAFRGCGSLSSLVIPESVVSIKGNLFCGWYGGLKCLSPNFIFEDGVLYDKPQIRNL